MIQGSSFFQSGNVADGMVSLRCLNVSKYSPPPFHSMPLKQGAAPTQRRDKPPMKKAQTPPPPSGPMSRPFKPLPEGGKPSANLRESSGVVVGSGGNVSAAAAAAGGGGVMVRQLPSREPGKPPNQREGRQKERQQHPPRR